MVAAFLALIMNPSVHSLQRRFGWRRGGAVGGVFAIGFLAFVGLATAFGYPLVNAVTHFAENAPHLVQQAQHGKGWIGHLVKRFHLENKVKQDSPKLTDAAQKLAKPALNVGKATATVVFELVTIVMMSLFMSLECGACAWHCCARCPPNTRSP